MFLSTIHREYETLSQELVYDDHQLFLLFDPVYIPYQMAHMLESLQMHK